MLSPAIVIVLLIIVGTLCWILGSVTSLGFRWHWRKHPDGDVRPMNADRGYWQPGYCHELYTDEQRKVASERYQNLCGQGSRIKPPNIHLLVYLAMLTYGLFTVGCSQRTDLFADVDGPRVVPMTQPDTTTSVGRVGNRRVYTVCQTVEVLPKQ